MGSSLVFQFLDINVLNYCYFHINCLTFLKIENVGKIKNVKKRIFYRKIKNVYKRLLQLWLHLKYSDFPSFSVSGLKIIFNIKICLQHNKLMCLMHINILLHKNKLMKLPIKFTNHTSYRTIKTVP